jgi:hypothetical protein
MIPVTTSNATPASSVGGTIPQQIWPPLTGWIDLSHGSESFVAGDPGPARIACSRRPCR